ncbi:hypothetical protein [Mesorhizobium neociceri]|uniref:DUF3618 domain-containing protein n=1 Tax=Mesorhizobium neociceri TaxID=1307853 RepID=A0A838BD43_9HYPH|nr:hypothetical protein [Mesorhizobium neociceri]MBA1144486.1 hypothetical protein [Mesorhizobium neociceri]
MIEKTSAELEDDAEVARAKVSDTADSIRNKMTPGQLIDEFSGMFTGDGGALTTLKAQVGANPLPVALVGVGLAWLMAGQGTRPAVGTSTATLKPYEQDHPRDFADYDGVADLGDHGLGDAGRGEVSKAASLVSGTAETVSTKASEAVDDISSRASEIATITAEQTAKATAAATDLLQREPLVLAALGLALGTAIGALLPRTDFEDEQVGQLSDKIRDQASEILEQGMERAKDVAAQAYQTVKDEADKQGLTGDGGALVDQVEQVVQATASKTEKSVRGKLKEVAEKLPGSDS